MSSEGFTHIVVITGGRDYSDLDEIERRLSQYPEDGVWLMHGGARGADELCALYAECERPKWVVSLFPAWWKTQKKAAGPIRNAKMARVGAWLNSLVPSGTEVVLEAFPGGDGTDNMRRNWQGKGLCTSSR